MSHFDEQEIAKFGGFDPNEHKLQVMTGYDDCIAGVVERFGQPPIVCYDKDKVIKSLCDDGMADEEALEYFDFNQLGAWVGELTPCFLSPRQDKKPDAHAWRWHATGAGMGWVCDKCDGHHRFTTDEDRPPERGCFPKKPEIK